MEVDTAAIRENLSLLRRKTGEGQMIMAVIKSNAYGHGSQTVAENIRDLVDAFGVALPEEALELREKGIDLPILILGYTDPIWSETLIENGIIPAVYTYDAAKALSDAALRLGKQALLMLTADTGMTRIGFPDNEDGIEAIKRMAGLPGLTIKGLFSHLACADEEDQSKAIDQRERFERFADRVENAGITLPLRSILNSAGGLRLDGRNEMIRAGIVLYGYAPSNELLPLCNGLRQAMSIRARVTRVETVPEGVGVSYGHTFVTNRETVVATVSAGYADGVPRSLSGCGTVLIRGRRVPILGRVCMDQMMVDVTEYPETAIGDIVTLLGRDGDETITADELAGLTHTISYEILCGFDRRRLPKVYLPS